MRAIDRESTRGRAEATAGVASRVWWACTCDNARELKCEETRGERQAARVAAWVVKWSRCWAINALLCRNHLHPNVAPHSPPSPLPVPHLFARAPARRAAASVSALHAAAAREALALLGESATDLGLCAP